MRTDSQRTIAGFRITINRQHQPQGWTWLDIKDINGAQAFLGFCREDDVALEIFDHIDRARAYTAACIATPPNYEPHERIKE